MHIADPRHVPTGLFIYTLRPARLAMLTDGPTADEQALAGQHWGYSQTLLTQGTLIFAGRTLQRVDHLRLGDCPRRIVGGGT